jgi:uncharacterized protein involved in type VI secretion and phage assembly
MEAPMHSLSNLFAQLGLPSDEAAIDSFIKKHRALTTSVALPDATYWTPAQAAFLREEILNDADWAEVIDQLNAKLHAKDAS